MKPRVTKAQMLQSVTRYSFLFVCFVCHLSHGAAAGSLKGYVTSSATRDTNRCVADVMKSLGNISAQGEKAGFQMRSLGDTDLFGHPQGVQRANHPMPTLLISGNPGDKPQVAVVAMDSLPQGQDSWKGNRDKKNRVPCDDAVVATLPLKDFTHVGGISIVGDFAVVGGSTFFGNIEGSKMLFFDVSEPRTVRQLPYVVDRIGPDRKDGGVGVAKLNDGRFLMVVENRRQSVDFYLSRGTDLAIDPQFEFRNRIGLDIRGLVLETYQNVNVLTQCDGSLYLAATRRGVWSRPMSGRNTVDLFRIHEIAGDIRLEKVFDRGWKSHGRCDFDAAAGLFVNGAGTIDIYCTQHVNGGAEIKCGALPIRRSMNAIFLNSN